MKRQLLMMLCLIGMAASVQAQTISGKLVDEQNQPLAYANVGKSEFGLDYFVSYRNYDTRYMDGYDRFSFPDGTTHDRKLTPIIVPFGYVQQTIEASYNLTQPDKYVFNVLFMNELLDTDKQDYSQRIVEKGKPDLTFFKHGEDHNHTPSLDIYYSCQLPNKQKITANVVGTYIGTDYLYDYKEWETEEDILSHYAYLTDGSRYSLIGEGMYSKEWEKAVLTAGVKGNTAHTKNIYTGTNGKTFRMNNSSLYGYVHLQKGVNNALRNDSFSILEPKVLVCVCGAILFSETRISIHVG